MKKIILFVLLIVASVEAGEIHGIVEVLKNGHKAQAKYISKKTDKYALKALINAPRNGQMKYPLFNGLKKGTKNLHVYGVKSVSNVHAWRDQLMDERLASRFGNDVYVMAGVHTAPRRSIFRFAFDSKADYISFKKDCQQNFADTGELSSSCNNLIFSKVILFTK